MRTLKRVLKLMIFLIISLFIGYIPAFLCVFLGSWILLLFGIIISDITGNIILWLLTILLGAYILADIIGKI